MINENGNATAVKSVQSVLAKSLKTYRVTSPLSHGVLTSIGPVNTDYGIGQFVELTDEEAEPLLGHTVVLAD